MSEACKTVRVQREASTDNPSGIVVINASDYNPDHDELAEGEDNPNPGAGGSSEIPQHLKDLSNVDLRALIIKGEKGDLIPKNAKRGHLLEIAAMVQPTPAE